MHLGATQENAVAADSGGVEQISLPLRVALIALVVIGGVWFVALRPKSDSPPASSTAPGATGLANDVAKAKGAAKTSDAANAAAGSDATGTAPSANGAAAQPGATAKGAVPAKSGLADDAVAGDPSKAVLSKVDDGKVAVLLFWNKNASDDRATRRTLRDIDLHHGKVVARAIPIGDVGKYQAITRGAQVLESPTVLVIGAGGKARAITGYTQAKEIDELVSTIGGKALKGK
jgi:hypothetical protein